MNPNSANLAEWRVIFFIIYYGLKAFTIDPPPDQRRKRETYLLKRKLSRGPQQIPDRSMKRQLAKDRTDLCRVFQAASRIYAAPRNRVYSAAMQPALYSMIFCTWENTIVVRGSMHMPYPGTCPTLGKTVWILISVEAAQSIICGYKKTCENLWNDEKLRVTYA